MPKHTQAIGSSVQTEAPQDIPPTPPIITPGTPPTEANPIEPAPTTTPEPTDSAPAPDANPYPEPVVDTSPEPGSAPDTDEPSPEPPTEERPVPEGDQPLESIPLGSAAEQAVTYAAKHEDPMVRSLLLGALADQKVFSQDQDLRYRMQVADNLREMMRWIRTNVPASASFKTFMEGVNSYLLMVETQGIPSMWSEEAASAPLDEIQARKAAMAIERAVEHMDLQEDDESEEEPEKAKKAKKKLATTLKKYAQRVREGKIK